jgi:hypothetical protein
MTWSSGRLRCTVCRVRRTIRTASSICRRSFSSRADPECTVAPTPCCTSCTPSQALLLCTDVESARMPQCTTGRDSRENRVSRHDSEFEKLQPPAVPTSCAAVGWPEGVAPSGSRRSRRDNRSSPGSCHPDHQELCPHAQWAKSRGYWLVTRCQQTAAFLMVRSRLYFLRIHRIR